MVEISDAQRAEVELIIDDFLNSPGVYFINIIKDLTDLGVDPNLDTMLAMFNGFLMGMFCSQMDTTEVRPFVELLKPILARRAWEIRQALLQERMK